jgi:hypothetical protein
MVVKTMVIMVENNTNKMTSQKMKTTAMEKVKVQKVKGKLEKTILLLRWKIYVMRLRI